MDEETREFFGRIIRLSLTDEDDVLLWFLVLETVISDVQLLQNDAEVKMPLYLEVGACSHWHRPHQTTWKPGGGFAYPSGYGGGHSMGPFGWPEHDTFVLFRWRPKKKQWRLVLPIYETKRKLICRVSIPTRTARHNQAAVRVVWSPGSPQNARRKLEILYGFRKREGDWKCVASRGFPRLSFEPKEEVGNE